MGIGDRVAGFLVRGVVWAIIALIVLGLLVTYSHGIFTPAPASRPASHPSPSVTST